MRLRKGRALQSGFFSLASCEPQRTEVMLSDSNPEPFFGICCNLHEDVSVIILIRFTSPSKFIHESSKFPPIKSQQLGTVPLLSQELDPGKKEGKRGKKREFSQQDVWVARTEDRSVSGIQTPNGSSEPLEFIAHGTS